MNYLELIWAAGSPATDELAVMQRELPPWVEDVSARGVRVLGRELADDDALVSTVRVRRGEALVTDGPFAETKEFMAGFDLYECDDLDAAAAVAATNPVAWFLTVELRPFVAGLRVGPDAAAFGRGEDTAAPYLLAGWAMADSPVAELDDETGAWREQLGARGVHILGAGLGAGTPALTLQARDRVARITHGPRIHDGALVASIDVVRCADRGEAAQLAATHPLAREHAIEVRPFWSDWVEPPV